MGQFDFSQYEVKPTAQPDKIDFSQYEVKKKDGGVGSIVGAGATSKGGGHDFNKGYQPTDQDRQTRQKFEDQENSFDKITDPKLKQKAQDQQQLADMHNKVENLKAQQELWNALTPEQQANVSRLSQISERNRGEIRAATPQEIADQHAMDSTLGKIGKSIDYIGSQGFKGGADVLKGASWIVNHLGYSGVDTQLIPDSIWKSVDKFTDTGITPGQRAQIEGGKSLGAGATRTLGMLANIVPAAVGGEYAEAPKAAFALQGLGQGQDVINEADPEHKINPLVRTLFVAGNGAVFGMIGSDLKSGLWGDVSKPVQDKIVGGIVSDALEKTIEENGTQQVFKDNFTETADKFIQQYGKATATAGVDLSALQAADYALKKGVDASSDKPVFNANLGSTLQNISDVMIKQAPILGTVGLLHADDVEKQKAELGKQITDLDNQIKGFSEKTEDPVKNAENEVNLEQATKQREDLNNKLKKIIQNEKEQKVSNGSTDLEVRGEGQESIDGRQVAERPEDTSEGSQNVTAPRGEDETGDVLTPSGEAGAEPDLKQEDNAVQEQETSQVDVRQQTGDGEGVGTRNQEHQEPAEQGQEEKGGKEVKKTILTKRAYEGEVQPEVKKHLEEKGLTRKSFSPQERSQQATEFINKFGDDAAFMAVKNNDVEGGLASSILAQLQIKNSEAIENLPEGSDEREDLAKKHADLIDLMEKKGYFSGEYVGQLAHEYQNKGLNFASIKRQVERLTKKPLTKEQTNKIKELTAQNEKLQNQLKEHEKKLIEETDKAFKSGEESVKNETKAQKAKRIADKIRQGKVNRPGIYQAATPGSLVWDGAVEVVAKSVEAGGKLADAIDDGLKHIRESDWYKGLSNSKQKEAEDAFIDHHDKTTSSNIRRLEKELGDLKENRVKKTPEKREPSDREKELKEEIGQEKQRIAFEDLQKRMADKKGNKFDENDAKDIWSYMKSQYIDKDIAYKDAISKTAQDLGLSFRQVSEAIITPKTQRMANDLWKKQHDYTRYRSAIKRWVGGQTGSPLYKWYKDASGVLRGIQVFGHGALFPGTHAGMTLFDAPNTAKTIKAFFNGYKFAYGDTGKFQQAMEELKSDPNYLIAQRAGLKNDPDRLDAEEYQKSQQYLEKIGLGKIAHSGERGFNAIKILRQQLFNYEFDKLPADLRDDPEVAKSIANLMNLATGATTVKIPAPIQELTFAGGMEAARWQKLLQSPVKATSTAIKTIVNSESATPAEKVFAKAWARRVGTELGVYMVARTANAAINNYVNPNNKEDVFDPTNPEWWKFKVPGVNLEIDPTSGMRGTAKFIHDIGKIAVADPAKDLHGEDRIKTLGKEGAQYAKGKVSPFGTDLLEIFSRRDFSGNVVPWSNEEPSKGHHKMTPLEYTWSKLPLPLAEAAATTYKAATETGANKIQVKDVIKGIMSGALSGATGFRVGESRPNQKPQSEFDKKMSSVSLTDTTGMTKKVSLTPQQVQDRRDIYKDLETKVMTGSDKTLKDGLKTAYDKIYNIPKNKEKRELRAAVWKDKGLSDKWIKDKEAELRAKDEQKFIEDELVKLTGAMMMPKVIDAQKKKNHSILEQ